MMRLKFGSLVLALTLAVLAAGCGQIGENTAVQEVQQTPEADWGLTLTAEDVTPTGLTLVITQSGGAPTGELQYGSDYGLEFRQNSAWKPVPEQPPEEGVWAWTDEAYLVEMEGTATQALNWTHLYGSLPAGQYRVVKSFMDFRGTGDYDTQMYTVEFTLE